MYFERAEVKEYKRKNSSKNYKQIHLGVNSEFKKNDEIIIITSDEFEDVSSKLEIIDGLSDTNDKLKLAIQEQKKEYESKINNMIIDKEGALKDKVDEMEQLLTEHETELANKDNEIEDIEAFHERALENKDNEIEKLNAKIDKLTSDHEKALGNINKELKELKVKLDESIKEIKLLNKKLNIEKDYSKALLIARSDLLNRNIIQRIQNKEPETSKLISNFQYEEIETNVRSDKS